MSDNPSAATAAQVNVQQKMNHKLNVFISWEDLKFKVPDPNDKKQSKTILAGLNGHVKPGELVAVIGPSGSGKSSFLNCIGGRTTEGVTGKIRFNGVKRPKNFARFTGYVVQDDLYLEALTVKESLTFAADLKLPMTMTKEQKRQRVSDIIRDLDLTNCQDTAIGIIGAGISGGERRRLAIGMEIINEPSLLLLDEPTSGLDSASALMVGKILKNLANKKNITILCTIHQPRYALAVMFDKIYFLAKGNEIYFGPTVPHCLEFFKNAGYTCPEYDNPADFLLDLVNTALDDNGNKTENETKEADATEIHISRVHSDPALSDKNVNNDQASTGVSQRLLQSRDEIITHLVSEYVKSDLKAKALDYSIPENDSGDKIFSTVDQAFYITPWYNQFRVVFVRSLLHKLREPIAFMTQAFSATVVPLIFGSIYFQIDLSQKASLDRLSAISILILMIAFFAFDILMLFPSEREIFNRENASGMYRPSMFYFGRTFAEMPQHIILIALMGTVAYWMYGLQNDGEKFLNYLILLELTALCGAGMLLVCGAFAANMEQSNLIATLFLLSFMLFDGNWVSIDKIPVYWRWVRWVSLFNYGAQGAIANEYRGLEFECTNSEIANGLCFYTHGKDVLVLRGLEDVNITTCIWALVGLTVGFRFLAFVGVLFLYRHKSAKQIFRELIGLDSSE